MNILLKILNFPIRVLNIEISWGFLAYKEGKIVILTYPVSFSYIACRYTSKWWLTIFWSGNPPPIHRTMTAYPAPTFRGIPEKKISSKWLQKINLKLLRCPGSVSFAVFFCFVFVFVFVFVFLTGKEIRRGWQPPSFGRWGLNTCIDYYITFTRSIVLCSSRQKCKKYLLLRSAFT